MLSHKTIAAAHWSVGILCLGSQPHVNGSDVLSANTHLQPATPQNKKMAKNKAKKEPETTFGERLKQAVASKGMEWVELAAALGVGPRTVNNWANNRTEPTLHQIATIAKMLGVSPAWLAFGEGD